MMTAPRNAVPARFLIAGLLIGTGVCLAGTASATTYTYQLISVPGSTQTDPVAVNKGGTVLGVWYDRRENPHGFIFSAGTVTTFDVPHSINTYPAGINAGGDIVGSYQDKQYNRHGFIRDAKGTFTTIDLPGSAYNALDGINDSGVAVGLGLDASGYQAVFTYANGIYTTVIDNHLSPVPVAINNVGSIAGYYDAPHTYTTSFLYANGNVSGLKIDYQYAASFALNIHNVVVGQAAEGSTEYGFIDSGHGKVKYIGPDGSTDSFNLGINDKGVVAGVSYPSDGSANSVGYTYRNGVFSILSVAGGTYTSANSVNNAGQVAGNYIDSNQVAQTFLATPAQ